jgi:hypothetical protein
VFVLHGGLARNVGDRPRHHRSHAPEDENRQRQQHNDRRNRQTRPLGGQVAAEFPALQDLDAARA